LDAQVALVLAIEWAGRGVRSRCWIDFAYESWSSLLSWSRCWRSTGRCERVARTHMVELPVSRFLLAGWQATQKPLARGVSIAWVLPTHVLLF